MQHIQFAVSRRSERNHNDCPPIPSYKELMEARQKRLEEKSKSAGALNVLRGLESSASMSKLPAMRTRYQQPALLKKLNYDFGSLKEFLSYDLKLKKPEELFKMSGEKKVEVKNKEDDLKKGLMQLMRQEVDNRDPKTILIEEKDLEKVSKAAKKFVTDMVGDIFKDDLYILERKIAQKGANRLYELIMDLDEDNPVRRIAEKYAYKTLADKFSILEAELEKKKSPDNQMNLNLKKPRGGINKNLLPGFGQGGQDTNNHSPAEIKQNQKGHTASNSKQMNYNANNLSVTRQDNYVYIDEDVIPSLKKNTSSSPSPKKREATENDRRTFAMRIIMDTASLAPLYTEYDRADKEPYVKELKQAEESGKQSKKDFYTLRDKERVAAITQHHVIFSNTELKPQLFMHICLNLSTYNSLWILNVRGSRLNEGLLWLMLKMVDKFSPDIRSIDISENQVSIRICDVLKDILTKHQLRTLKMAGMGLKSKGLAVICLGLAENTTMAELDLNYNDIDEFGFKTLALILRHTKTLQSVKILRKKTVVELPNGEEKEVEEELGYTAMAALTKAFKYNKNLDPKNVLLFEAKSG